MYIALGIVLGVIGIVAWVVVAYATLRIMLLVPAGKRLKALSLLRLWKFPELGRFADAAAVAPHANLYLRAFMVFLGCAVCGLVVWGVAFIDAQSRPSADPATISAPSSQ